MPDDGWDGVIRQGWLARKRERPLDAVSALEITVRRDLLGSGLSPTMVAGMRDHAARLGFRSWWRRSGRTRSTSNRTRR